jgi:hypothetical protein
MALRREIGEDEPVALHDLTGLQPDRMMKGRRLKDQSVELTVLAVRIHSVRQRA